MENDDMLLIWVSLPDLCQNETNL